MARCDSMPWLGPDLEPVTSTDPLAVCVLLSQPSFVTGELQLRPFCSKEEQLAAITLVSFILSLSVHWITLKIINYHYWLTGCIVFTQGI